eukprot:jgi/Orpsp1_1/1189012/evm.model.d7180000068814.1
MAKDNKNKKVIKKTGPNEKIPEPEVNFKGIFKAMFVGVAVACVFIFCLMNGYFDKFLIKENTPINVADSSATISAAGTKTIPVNLPPKITATTKSVPKSTNIKSANEPGYKVSGGKTSTGEKGWIKEVVKPGDGKTFPKKGDVVVMHYVGKLANGKVFDSSRQRGQPFRTVIGVGRLIKGWDEGIPTMSLGESAILSIQPEYGYGARGAGASIPPNSELIFEVELLEIDAKN